MNFNKNLLLILLTFYNILFAGFIPTALVKTPIGYTEIQYLKKGDFVISFNGKELIANKVTHANSYVVKELATIYFSDGSKSACSLDQKFYLPMQDKWVIAKSLCKNDFLISVHGIYKTVEDAVISTNEVFLYEITVVNDHNYYASDVLVHNPIPAMVSGGFAFGGGAVEFVGASVTVLGGLLGFMFSKKKHKQNNSALSIGNVAVSFGGSPDPGDDKEKKKISVNQIQQMINKKQCPKSVKRIDKANGLQSPQDHMHFKDGGAINRSGTWRHGGRNLSQVEKEFLLKIGFTLP